ncbi:MAG: cytochrome c, partial [Acetobacteraceae bacterium]
MKKDQLNRYLRLVAPHLVAAAMTIAACGLAQAQGSTGARPAASSQPAGLYMEQLSDCMACHTRPGGTPFAGGREIGTPFGTVTSPNITPDKDTGI